MRCSELMVCCSLLMDSSNCHKVMEQRLFYVVNNNYTDCLGLCVVG